MTKGKNEDHAAAKLPLGGTDEKTDDSNEKDNP
jgi:hypothetical protein